MIFLDLTFLRFLPRSTFVLFLFFAFFFVFHITSFYVFRTRVFFRHMHQLHF